MSRYKFRQRSQQAGESVIQFVMVLRELATFCSFGGLCEEMIRDQLIEKTSMNQIRERLLMEPDSLTVDRAIQLAHWLVIRPNFSRCRGNLFGLTENQNTLLLRQVSRLQNVMAAFRENGTQIVVLVHTTHTTSPVPHLVCSANFVVKQIVLRNGVAQNLL